VAEAMSPRDPKDGVGDGGNGALDPEVDIEAPLISSGSSFSRDAVYGDNDCEGDEEQRRRRRRFLLGGLSHSNTTSQVALVGADVCPIESLDYE
jgi:chloride channel 7